MRKQALLPWGVLAVMLALLSGCAAMNPRITMTTRAMHFRVVGEVAGVEEKYAPDGVTVKLEFVSDRPLALSPFADAHYPTVGILTTDGPFGIVSRHLYSMRQHGRSPWLDIEVVPMLVHDGQIVWRGEGAPWRELPVLDSGEAGRPGKVHGVELGKVAL